MQKLFKTLDRSNPQHKQGKEKVEASLITTLANKYDPHWHQKIMNKMDVKILDFFKQKHAEKYLKNNHPLRVAQITRDSLKAELTLMTNVFNKNFVPTVVCNQTTYRAPTQNYSQNTILQLCDNNHININGSTYGYTFPQQVKPQNYKTLHTAWRKAQNETRTEYRKMKSNLKYDFFRKVKTDTNTPKPKQTSVELEEKKIGSKNFELDKPPSSQKH